MSSIPIIPPGGMPPIPPYWREESDWIVLIEFLRKDNAEDRVRGAEAIGYMFAYSQMTDTRMLALVGDPKEDAYELLFSFSSPGNKAEFLRLLQSNDATACEESEILVPDPSEIAAAQPSHECCPRTSYGKLLSSLPCCSAAIRTPSSDLSRLTSMTALNDPPRRSSVIRLPRPRRYL